MKQRMLCVDIVRAIGLSVTAAAAAEPVRIAQAMPAMLPAYEVATIVRSVGLRADQPGDAAAARPTCCAPPAATAGEMRVVVDARRGEHPVGVAGRGRRAAGRAGRAAGPYEPVRRRLHRCRPRRHEPDRRWSTKATDR